MNIFNRKISLSRNLPTQNWVARVRWWFSSISVLKKKIEERANASRIKIDRRWNWKWQFNSNIPSFICASVITIVWIRWKICIRVHLKRHIIILVFNILACFENIKSDIQLFIDKSFRLILIFETSIIAAIRREQFRSAFRNYTQMHANRRIRKFLRRVHYGKKNGKLIYLKLYKLFHKNSDKAVTPVIIKSLKDHLGWKDGMNFYHIKRDWNPFVPFFFKLLRFNATKDIKNIFDWSAAISTVLLFKWLNSLNRNGTKLKPSTVPQT